MIKYIKCVAVLAAAALFSVSCEDLRLGDGGLSKAPETDGATLDTLFRTLKDSDKVLMTAYNYLPYNIPTKADYKLGGNCLEDISDLSYSFRTNISDGPRNLYYTGTLSASLSGYDINCEAFRFGSENNYTAIRYGWIYVENAYRIPDATQEQINTKIAEAKMCIAVAYADMLRYVGGVPILDHAIDPNEDMHFPRATFAETVDFIVRLCDEAAPHLPWFWSGVDDGRMSKAGAIALKLRVLCFAASPTFNSSTPFHSQANEYHCYMNNDANRWTRAKEAAEEFMREWQLNGYYQLVQPTEQTHQARRLAYRRAYAERGTTETLISIRKTNAYVAAASPHYNDYWYWNRLLWGPTLNWVNMYPWDDGSDFIPDPDDPSGFDWANPPRQPFFETDGTPGTPTRDPRLYENIGVPGDIYWNGTVAPIHTNHDNYRAGCPGFVPMKYVFQYGTDRNTPPHFAFIRLPEVLLNAAEAINEADGGPNGEAVGYVNQVRARVGLKPIPSGLDQTGFREVLLRERACEFGYEEVRWFDLIRYGREKDFRKKLYGLTSVAVDSPNTPSQFTFEYFELPITRAWASDWNTKWYLAPIPSVELDKDYGMTQNPGW